MTATGTRPDLASVCPAPFVRWSVESFGVRITDDLGIRSLALEYPAAAVWEFITQGRSLSDVARLTGAVACLPDEAAHGLIDALVRTWLSDRWLEAASPIASPWPTSP